MAFLTVKRVGSLGLLAYLAYLLYEPMPANIADPFALWVSAKIRRSVRFINRLRGRGEFEMDLLEAFLTPPDFKDEKLKIYDHLGGENYTYTAFPAFIAPPLIGAPPFQERGLMRKLLEKIMLESSYIKLYISK